VSLPVGPAVFAAGASSFVFARFPGIASSISVPESTRLQTESFPPASAARSLRLTGGRRPVHEAHTIEAKQAEVGAQPEIPVEHLGNGIERSFEVPVADRPGFVRVLGDLVSRIQRESARAREQPRQHGADKLD
jgi:hypothetical protein